MKINREDIDIQTLLFAADLCREYPSMMAKAAGLGVSVSRQEYEHGLRTVSSLANTLEDLARTLSEERTPQ